MYKYMYVDFNVYVNVHAHVHRYVKLYSVIRDQELKTVPTSTRIEELGRSYEYREQEMEGRTSTGSRKWKVVRAQGAGNGRSYEHREQEIEGRISIQNQELGRSYEYGEQELEGRTSARNQELGRCALTSFWVGDGNGGNIIKFLSHLLGDVFTRALRNIQGTLQFTQTLLNIRPSLREQLNTHLS